VGLSDPHDSAAYDALLPSVTVGPLSPLSGPLEVRDYDPAWPAAYAREATRVRAVLGERVVRLEHVGSTSVPGLPAKPIIDLVLEVAESSDERAYVPDLETAGYMLRIREPSFLEHRMLRDADRHVHLHVFSAGCPETERMVRFPITSAQAPPTVTSTPLPSAIWPRAGGSTCSSTPTPRAASSRRSWLAPRPPGRRRSGRAARSEPAAGGRVLAVADEL
jgi:GrpB-like predicted nucleotidyltransferase (UPF0157 family)